MNKEVLLKVADQIEADPNYNGECWIVKGTCGCAMVRILKESGAEFETDESDVDVKETFHEFKLNGKSYGYGSDIPKNVALVVNLDYDLWNDFQEFSIGATAAETAQALRKIAETGDYRDAN